MSAGRVGVALTLAVLAGPVLMPAAATAVTPTGGVTAQVTAVSAVLSDALVDRRWTLNADGTVVTSSLRNASSELSSATSPDFRVDVDGVPTTSVLGWSLISVTPGAIPPDPSRPQARPGRQLTFRYALADNHLTTAGVELTRVVALHEGSAVLETTTTLTNRTPAVVRIGQYSLDELTPASALITAPAQVIGYSGGSDWRDDYRHTLPESGAFDDEGETARFGASSGWFFVTERRGGAASRVGREAGGRSWAGVDPGRDLFDFGPLKSDPPDYNRLENPAYPAPIRQRTLQPAGTLALGRAFTGVYDGGEAGAAAAFVDDFTTNVAPQFPLTVGQNSFHPWNHSADLNGTVLAKQVDRAAALGIDTYMIDDQWQGGAGGESGDWRFDPVRFPDADADGIPDFVEYLHSKGMSLGLWMSPAEFNTASATYAAHPDWACAPTGDVTAQVSDDAGLGVWDMTNPALRDHLTGVVDRLVSDYDVREFKFDFQSWVDCGTHDYNDYEDAFVAFVHAQQVRHPGVTFELDETNDQRAWPFESAAIGPSWFDNGHLHGSGKAAKLLHDMWSAAPWLPTSDIGVGSFDGVLPDGCAGPCTAGYLAPLMLLGHVTFWTDTTKISDADAAEIAWWTRWYAAHRDDLRGVVHELTRTDPLGGAGTTVLQPWRGSHGELFAFRQAGGSPVATVALQGVDPATTYAIHDVRTGELVTTATGAALAAGYDVALPADWSARVLSVDPTTALTPGPDVPEAPVAVLLPLTALVAGALLFRRKTSRRTP